MYNGIMYISILVLKCYEVVVKRHKYFICLCVIEKEKKRDIKDLGGWWDSFALGSIRCRQYISHSIGKELKKKKKTTLHLNLYLFLLLNLVT